VINTSSARELDDQQGSAATDAAAAHDRLPDSGWTVLAARPVAQVRQVSAHRPRAAEESGEHHDQRLHLGRTFLLGVLIIFL
jgi:hypothetical protein